MTAKVTFQENAMRIIAVIGLIAVLLLGAWGIIQLAFFIPSFLGTIGNSLNNSKNQAAVVTTATTTVQTPLVVQTPAVVAPAQETKKPVAEKPAAKPAATYIATTQPRAALYGYPDLQVRIINMPANVRAGQQVNLQFVIENVGTNMVPANWFFTASLPYSPVYTYQSPVQQALYPGDKIVYTLGYTAPYAYDTTDSMYGWSYPYWTLDQSQAYGQMSTVSIDADPYNLVRESNENNNTASATYQAY